MKSSYTSNAQLLISQSALRNNLAVYRSLLGEKTKLLLMIKANGYGTDSVMVASAVDYHVDYLGAAYSTNAYQLKESGIQTPIMVMAPEPDDLSKIAEYTNVEPVLYSLDMIKAAADLDKPLNVHVEVDSGMKRLGLHKEEIEEAITLLNSSKLNVTSCFSHLVAPGEAIHDAFTHTQANYFNECFDQLSSGLTKRPLKHLLSSGGTNRFPQYQYDMVRIGIGFYGYDPSGLMQEKLNATATLQTKVLQVLDVDKEETVGYSRKGSLPYDGKVATISIGYGDGYLRVFGNGNAEVMINGKRAKTVGNVCMDLTMIDVTHIDCKPGDIVELFGPNITIEEMSQKAQTIPYEILTNISPRVERILVS